MRDAVLGLECSPRRLVRGGGGVVEFADLFVGEEQLPRTGMIIGAVGADVQAFDPGIEHLHGGMDHNILGALNINIHKIHKGKGAQNIVQGHGRNKAVVEIVYAGGAVKRNLHAAALPEIRFCTI